MPHLAAMPEQDPVGESSAPESWLRLLGAELLPARSTARRWTLTPAAREAFRRHQQRWKRQARDGETASTSAALVKADVHLLRVLLVVAEGDRPTVGGEVTPGQVDRAAEIIEYVLAGWRALPEAEGLALSLKDERLDRAVERLRDWLEQHGGQATRRTLLRAAAGGARTREDLEAILRRYEAIYPGCVGESRPAHGGPTALVVRAPERVHTAPRVVSADNAASEIQPTPARPAEYESQSETAPEGAVSAADNGGADNVPADNGSDPQESDDGDDPGNLLSLDNPRWQPDGEAEP